MWYVSKRTQRHSGLISCVFLAGGMMAGGISSLQPGQVIQQPLVAVDVSIWHDFLFESQHGKADAPAVNAWISYCNIGIGMHRTTK